MVRAPSPADAELPAAWSPATLGAVCGLLVALVQEPQLLAALDMVMAIGSVRTLDELIVQVGCLLTTTADACLLAARQAM